MICVNQGGLRSPAYSISLDFRTAAIYDVSSMPNSLETINEGLDVEYKLKDPPQIPGWIVNEAHLINDAMKQGAVSTEEAQAWRGEQGAIFGDEKILELMRELVNPKLFVELPFENLDGNSRGISLQKLFCQKMVDEKGDEMELGDYLAKKRMGLSIAMSSLDDETAEAFQYLNEKGVPIIAWVVIEDVEGYWTNAANIPETTLKTKQILRWAHEKGIDLHAVGFDLEKPLQLLAAVAKLDIVTVASEIRNYAKSAKNITDPKKKLRELTDFVKRSGQQTEAYTFPSPLGPVLGGISPEGADFDNIVEMLYLGPGLARLLRNKKLTPAFGIAARPELDGLPEERPGRDFQVVNEMRSGKRFEDIQRKPVGPNEHRSQQELNELVKMWLDQEINIKNRTFKMRDVYLFAMNDYRVAMMLAEAIDTGFDRQKEKIVSLRK